MGITQKSAWLFAQEIREKIIDETEIFGDAVKVDEAYAGGLDKERALKQKIARRPGWRKGLKMEKSQSAFSPDSDPSLVAEIDVRRELAAEGWLTVNMNTEKANFPNVDLLAVKGDVVHPIQVKSANGENSIQVKSANGEKGTHKNSHKNCLYLGHAEGWLREQEPFFNGKPGPLTCSVVVLVNVRRERSRFVVLPVALAEKIARAFVEGWYEVPKKTGDQRSPGFDARPYFISLPPNRDPLPYEVATMNTVCAYENRWDILSEELTKLRDPSEWDLVQGSGNVN